MGRGERVVPGVWRLRLPLPWPAVPHCNAWALAAGDGIVLVDCGAALPGSMRHLERALEQVGLRLEHVRLLVGTHAHVDHCGQAAAIQAQTGCELWLHPRHEHANVPIADPEGALAASVRAARADGVPAAALAAWEQERRQERPGMSGPLAPARDLLPGVELDTDVGTWQVLETPGHAPSHVVLHQPERRLLITGDHVLGRIALFFEYGWSPDPVGQFLASLERVEGLDVRLSLAGHGRPFTDFPGHVSGTRALVHERLDAVQAALAAHGAATAFDVLPDVYGERFTPPAVPALLTKARAYLEHLEAQGRARRVDDDPVRWSPA